MAYKEDYSKMDGVWRTVGGRRIFIKTGQTLTEAMRESGKFQKNKNQSKKTKIDDLKQEKERIENEYNEMRKRLSEKLQELAKERKFSDEETDKLREKINSLEEELEKINKKLKKEEFKIEKEKIGKLISDLENKYTPENIKHEFYSENLKFNFEYYLDEDDSYYNKAIGIIALDIISKELGLETSNSPYSFSSYAFKKGEEITWGSKPMDSYRLSDHWNFQSRGEIHCRLSNTKEYTQKLILAKYNGKTYDIIKEWD